MPPVLVYIFLISNNIKHLKAIFSCLSELSSNFLLFLMKCSLVRVDSYSIKNNTWKSCVSFPQFYPVVRYYSIISQPAYWLNTATNLTQISPASLVLSYVGGMCMHLILNSLTCIGSCIHHCSQNTELSHHRMNCCCLFITSLTSLFAASLP